MSFARPRRHWLWAVGLTALVAIAGSAAFAQDKGPVTLLIHPTLYQATGGDNGLIKEFTQQTGIKVDIVTAPSDQLHQKATVAYIAGNGSYDVATLENAWITNEMANFLAPLGEDVQAAGDSYNFSGIVASLRQIDTVDGKLLAVPFRSGTTMIYYRKDLLQKAGVQPPQTMQELYDAAKKLTQDTNGDGKPDVYGLVVRGQVGFQLIQDFQRTLLAEGGSLLNSDMSQCTLDNAAGVKTIKLWTDLYQNGYVPPDMLSLGRDDEIRLLQTGKAAMGIYFSPYYGRIIQGVDPSLIGWAVMPTAPGVQKGRGLNTLWSLAIDKHSKHKDAAWKLVQWLTNKANQTTMAVQYNNGPVRGAVYTDPTFTKKYPMASDWLTATAASGFEPSQARYPKMVDIVSQELTNAVQGKESPEAAAQASCKQIDALLQ